MTSPNDDVVKKAIISIMKKMDDKVRPNKLRKIICKEVNDTDWNQFRRVLDTMIEKNILHTEGRDGDVFVLLGQEDKLRNVETSVVSSTHNAEDETAVIEVPQALIFHLVAKGRKKQKNIELNTKTKISFDKSVFNKEEATNFDKKMNLTITKYLPREYVDKSQTEVRDTAKKHVKTARLMITKMIEAYKKNPDHFQPNKSGGTLAEQDEAKIKKLEAPKGKRKTKKSDDSIEKSNNRSKTRKFY